MATTMIKVRRCYQMKKAEYTNFLSLENKKVTGGYATTEKQNTKHPLSEDAVIFPAIGKCLQ